MKYLAAYALLALSGKKDISAADVKKVLGDAQIKADDADINRLLESVKGKPIHQLIADGSKQIGSSGPAPAASAPAAKAADTKKDAPKEEPKKADKK
jgi:ribosomal protein L12E/L44/L45/RPP1/RPP2